MASKKENPGLIFESEPDYALKSYPTESDYKERYPHVPEHFQNYLYREYSKRKTPFPPLTKTMLGFEGKGMNDEITYYTSQPEVKFLPVGLMIFGQSDATMIETELIDIRVGQQSILASWPSIPASIFSVSKSFEQIQELIKNGSYDLSSWITFPVVEIGNQITIMAKGKIKSLAMWGYALFYSY